MSEKLTVEAFLEEASDMKKRIEKLENDMKEKKLHAYYNLKERIEKLEANKHHWDNFYAWSTDNNGEIININRLKKEISELRNQIQNNAIVDLNHFEITRSDLKTALDYTTRWAEEFMNAETILKDHLKAHIKVSRDQIGNVDQMTVFVDFDEAMEKQLAKLDGGKTVEDISVFEKGTPQQTDSKPPSCNKCNLYGECDHQGAYKKDGKWCYEPYSSKPPSSELYRCDVPGCNEYGYYTHKNGWRFCEEHSKNPSEQDIMGLRGWEQQNEIDKQKRKLEKK